MKISEMIRMAQTPEAELDMGRQVEMEHKATIEYLRKNPNAPLEKVVEMIARDHLKEIPDYYTRLKKMEAEGKSGKTAKVGQADPIQKKLMDFFKANPNPPDSKVHKLAEQLKLPPDQLESKIYELLSDLLKRTGE